MKNWKESAREWRNKFFAFWGPAALVISVVLATFGLGLTNGLAFLKAITEGLTDEPKLGQTLGFINIGLITALTMFVIIRWSALGDAIKALTDVVGDIKRNLDKSQKDIRRDEAEVESLQQMVGNLKKRIASGGHHEDDRKSLWDARAGSRVLQFNCKLNRECREVVRPTGVEFEATDWAENWLKRIAVGTAVSDWRIVLYIPKVEGPFEATALLPAKKHIFLFDHLVAGCERLGRAYTLDHVRISIIRNVKPEHQHLAISELTIDVDGGPEDICVTYHRAPTSRAVEYYGGKVLVHRGADDRKAQADIAEHYFHAGIRMTVDELRTALVTGVFPDDVAPDNTLKIHL